MRDEAGLAFWVFVALSSLFVLGSILAFLLTRRAPLLSSADATPAFLYVYDEGDGGTWSRARYADVKHMIAIGGDVYVLGMDGARSVALGEGLAIGGYRKLSDAERTALR